MCGHLAIVQDRSLIRHVVMSVLIAGIDVQIGQRGVLEAVEDHQVPLLADENVPGKHSRFEGHDSC